MTEVEELAAFVNRSRYAMLSSAAREQLKIRVLDTLGCAIGALTATPLVLIHQQIEDFGGNPLASLIGGGKTAPDRAAFYNGALVRYLDFMDSYLAKGETCHPCDNFGAVLAAAEYADASGETLLTALALAYQVQARLSDEAPVRARGFDHTTQGAFAVGAGVAKALGLDAAATANAIALAAVGNIALRVTRTGTLSEWKGLAYPNTAFIGTHAAFLAKRGITGPREIFEGNKGFKETISGPFTIDWAHEDLERVAKTIVKKYNAEIHSQSALEGALELRAQHHFDGAAIDKVEVDIFDVAHKIIGGGEEGDKTKVAIKEQADHSLQYMLAAALLDGDLLPAQYAQDRITAPDVQNLLRRVTVRPNAAYSARFPDEMACRVMITLKGGQHFAVEKHDYQGFHTAPMSWSDAAAKFHRLTAPFVSPATERAITNAVENLEHTSTRAFASVLKNVAVEDRPGGVKRSSIQPHG